MDRQSVMIGCAYLRRRPLPFAKDSEVVVLVVLIILLKQEEVAIVAEIASLLTNKDVETTPFRSGYSVRSIFFSSARQLKRLARHVAIPTINIYLERLRRERSQAEARIEM